MPYRAAGPRRDRPMADGGGEVRDRSDRPPGRPGLRVSPSPMTSSRRMATGHRQCWGATDSPILLNK